MQCLGIPSCRRRSVSRSRELYLREQSRRVAALNGQRLGKGCGDTECLLRGMGQQLERGAPAFEPQMRQV